jgi:hypothetical protein
VKWEDLHHLLNNGNVEVTHTLDNPHSCAVSQVIIIVCQHCPHSHDNSEDVVIQLYRPVRSVADLMTRINTNFAMKRRRRRFISGMRMATCVASVCLEDSVERIQRLKDERQEHEI